MAPVPIFSVWTPPTVSSVSLTKKKKLLLDDDDSMKKIMQRPKPPPPQAFRLLSNNNNPAEDDDDKSKVEESKQASAQNNNKKLFRLFSFGQNNNNNNNNTKKKKEQQKDDADKKLQKKKEQQKDPTENDKKLDNNNKASPKKIVVNDETFINIQTLLTRLDAIAVKLDRRDDDDDDNNSRQIILGLQQELQAIRDGVQNDEPLQDDAPTIVNKKKQRRFKTRKDNETLLNIDNIEPFVDDFERNNKHTVASITTAIVLVDKMLASIDEAKDEAEMRDTEVDQEALQLLQKELESVGNEEENGCCAVVPKKTATPWNIFQQKEKAQPMEESSSDAPPKKAAPWNIFQQKEKAAAEETSSDAPTKAAWNIFPHKDKAAAAESSETTQSSEESSSSDAPPKKPAPWNIFHQQKDKEETRKFDWTKLLKRQNDDATTKPRKELDEDDETINTDSSSTPIQQQQQQVVVVVPQYKTKKRSKSTKDPADEIDGPDPVSEFVHKCIGFLSLITDAHPISVSAEFSHFSNNDSCAENMHIRSRLA